MQRTGARERLIVFAKAPEPGRVKTRLIPALGAVAAAHLHTALIERAMGTARAVEGAELELHAAGADHPILRDCARRHDAALVEQSAGDLGERMHRAFERSLIDDRCTAVVLIGSDCPALSTCGLQTALEALRRGCPAVIGPAEDGGYVLIGLARGAPELFRDMPWSTEHVLERTRERLRKLRWHWHELDTLWDVDRPADYERLRRSGLMETDPAGPV